MRRKIPLIANLTGKIRKFINAYGNPAQTSGAQKWLGAADNLNKKPAKINKLPTFNANNSC